MASSSDEDTVFQVGQKVVMDIFSPLPGPDGGYKIRSPDGQLWVMTRAPYILNKPKQKTIEEELAEVKARLADLDEVKARLADLEKARTSADNRATAMEHQAQTFWHMHFTTGEKLGNIERRRRRRRQASAAQASTAE